MRRQLFRDLGQSFYEWYKSGSVRFVYGTEGKDLNRKIGHLAVLIEYVTKKKGNLLNKVQMTAFPCFEYASVSLLCTV